MQAFPFVFSVSSFLSHFFQSILSLLLSQSRCFPSTLSPPTHSHILRTPFLPSARGSPGARTCLGRVPAWPRQGTDSDVAGRTGPARPADVTAAAVPTEAQEWEFKEGSTAVTPRLRLSAASARHALGFSGQKARILLVAQAEPTSHPQRTRKQEFRDKGNVLTRWGLVRTRLGWRTDRGELGGAGG